jgi:hypothetical protein
VVGLSDPCGVGFSQYENVCGANRYSVGWCGSECHSVQLGGGAIVKAPQLPGREYSQGRRVRKLCVCAQPTVPEWYKTGYISLAMLDMPLNQSHLLEESYSMYCKKIHCLRTKTYCLN